MGTFMMDNGSMEPKMAEEFILNRVLEPIIAVNGEMGKETVMVFSNSLIANSTKGPSQNP